MDNFRFHARTKVLFGKGQVQALAEEVAVFGKNVLLTYGGGSIKRNGIYDEVMQQLKDCKVTELSGIEPNPRIESVREGARLCKENQIDVVVAVGGGSTIDCSKVIAAAANYDGDAWDLVMNPQKIGKVLPIIDVLTLSATGSEMNGNAVISDLNLRVKKGTFSWDMVPMVSICDPTYLFTLPAYQTASGTADIMSHVIENYFKREKYADVQDGIAEALLRTCIKNCPIALAKPDDYHARANLMWASTVALNGSCGVGKGGAWTCHAIEHELSAYYDVTHGAGLAVVTPRWMRYILSEETVGKFADYAVKVWGIAPSEDLFETAQKGIEATEDFFFHQCKLPKTLKEMGIPNDEHFADMAKSVAKGTTDSYVPLTEEDIISILNMCL